YDRTTVSTSNDQHLIWNLFRTPASITPPSTGTKRYDVSNATDGFIGTMTTLLPAGHTTSMVNIFNSNKMYRIEVTPGNSSLSQQWLTAFDASTSAAAVALASTLSSANGNSSANVTGALLRASSTNNLALLRTR